MPGARIAPFVIREGGETTPPFRKERTPNGIPSSRTNALYLSIYPSSHLTQSTLFLKITKISNFKSNQIKPNHITSEKNPSPPCPPPTPTHAIPPHEKVPAPAMIPGHDRYRSHPIDRNGTAAYRVVRNGPIRRPAGEAVGEKASKGSNGREASGMLQRVGVVKALWGFWSGAVVRVWVSAWRGGESKVWLRGRLGSC